MPIADLGATELYYELEGDSALPTVVLSNSLGADLSMWDAQMPALLRSFRVLRYDTRGHGGSTVPPGQTTLDALARDLLSLLDSLALPHVHLCGVSLGGLTAMWVAIHAPGRLHSLVLSNTAAKIGNATSWNDRIAAVQAGGLQAIADSVSARWFTAAFLDDAATLATQRNMLLGCSREGYVAPPPPSAIATYAPHRSSHPHPLRHGGRRHPAVGRSRLARRHLRVSLPGAARLPPLQHRVPAALQPGSACFLEQQSATTPQRETNHG